MNLIILSIFCLSFSLTVVKGADSVTKFNFNHPPLPEHYEPIPVSIVFDGSQAQETNVISSTEKTITTYHPRRLKLPKKFKESNEIDVTPATTPSTTTTPATTTTTKATTTTARATTLKSTVPTSRRKYPTKEGKIPVAVIYDDPRDTTRSFLRRGNKRYRRPNQSVQENKSVQITNNDYVTKKMQATTQATVTTQKVHEFITEKVKPKVFQSRVSSQTDETKVDGNTKRVKDPVVPIVNSENHVYGDRGDFNYSYQSGDGTMAFETGVLKKNTQNLTGEAVSGGFSYTDKDGTSIRLSYTADENGYRPVGDHLPTPPPVPAAIARALLYLATKTPVEEVTESL